MGRTQGARNLALGKVEGRLPDGVGNARLQQGGVHRLPLPGLEGVDVGAEDTVGGQGAGGDVGDGHPHLGRRAVWKAGNAHQAAHSLGHQVKAAPVAVGAGGAKPGNGAVNQAGLDLGQFPIAQLQPLHNAGAKVFHHHVGVLQQSPEHLPARLFPQVQGQAALVAVQRQKAGRPAAIKGRPHPPGIVAAIGLLNLHHVRAHIGQQHSANRPGHDLGQIQHFHTGQRGNTGQHSQYSILFEDSGPDKASIRSIHSLTPGSITQRNGDFLCPVQRVIPFYFL